MWEKVLSVSSMQHVGNDCFVGDKWFHCTSFTSLSTNKHLLENVPDFPESKILKYPLKWRVASWGTKKNIHLFIYLKIDSVKDNGISKSGRDMKCRSIDHDDLLIKI